MIVHLEKQFVIGTQSLKNIRENMTQEMSYVQAWQFIKTP